MRLKQKDSIGPKHTAKVSRTGVCCLHEAEATELGAPGRDVAWVLPTGSHPSCSEARAPAHETPRTHSERASRATLNSRPHGTALSFRSSPSWLCHSRLSKAVWNPFTLPARATSGGSSIPQIHYLLRGIVFPPTCPELACSWFQDATTIFQDPTNKPSLIRSTPFTGRSACACPQPF